MKLNSPIFFIEINKKEFVFLAGDILENNSFEVLHKNSIPIQGISEKKISNFDLIYNLFKENIYSIEQKLKFTFKDVILLINNFDCLVINISGFKN